jgi:hypothetical protein
MDAETVTEWFRLGWGEMRGIVGHRPVADDLRDRGHYLAAFVMSKNCADLAAAEDQLAPDHAIAAAIILSTFYSPGRLAWRPPARRPPARRPPSRRPPARHSPARRPPAQCG